MVYQSEVVFEWVSRSLFSRGRLAVTLEDLVIGILRKDRLVKGGGGYRIDWPHLCLRSNGLIAYVTQTLLLSDSSSVSWLSIAECLSFFEWVFDEDTIFQKFQSWCPIAIQAWIDLTIRVSWDRLLKIIGEFFIGFAHLWVAITLSATLYESSTALIL
mgnify:CR=1 FL=1